MFVSQAWQTYEVLDTGAGEKLERWGPYLLSRPDPQVIWPQAEPALWRKADARYCRSDTGGGEWQFHQKLPERWEIEYGSLRFYVRPTGFKHTGLFPEQAANWDWMADLVQEADRTLSGQTSPGRTSPGRPVRALNLFAYTGGATLALARAGAEVCHVDAAKGMVQWARENYVLSGLPENRARWIVDDALKFVQRELRRGRRYEAVVMDPPSDGRGPGGEVWKLEEALYPLVEACAELLSEAPLFFLINSYTTGLQPAVLDNVLRRTVVARFGGTIDAQELGLPVRTGGSLPCGASGRWRCD